MTDVIGQLKQEHQALLYLFQKARQAPGHQTEQEPQTDVAGHHVEIASVLASARNLLTKHMETEAKLLHPVLKTLGKLDPELDQLVDSYLIEMDELARSADEFFSRYDKDHHALAIDEECLELIERLEERIEREESILYEEYSTIQHMLTRMRQYRHSRYSEGNRPKHPFIPES